MKKLAFLLTGLSAFCCSAANAGSMGAAEEPHSNWTGFYAGLNAGYGWSSATTNIQPIPAGGDSVLPYSLNDTMSGGGLGAQVGYNWQMGAYPGWVVGLEADIQWSSLSGSATGRAVGVGTISNEIFYNALSTKQSTSWFGTIRPRVGYLVADSVLIYGTGGFAYGNMDLSANSHFITNAYGYESYPASQNNGDYGWTAGAGLEWAPMQQWSVKFEYLYYNLGSVSIVANPTTPNPIIQTKYTWTNPPQLLRLGVNYHF